MNGRINMVILVLGISVVVIVGRLFFWQFIKAQELSEFARSQYIKGQEIKAKRGSIVASDGQPLALSRLAWTLWVEPPKFQQTPGEIAEILAPLLVTDQAKEATTSAQTKNIFEEEKKRLYALLSRENAQWVLLDEKMTEEQKRAIEELGIPGIGFSEDEARLYPEGSMSASLLGFVGKNKNGTDEGYFGLEGFYNLTLSGKAGYRKEEQDTLGNPIPFGILTELLPIQGSSLLTYIDRTVQYTVEKHLREGILKYGAKSGSVIVMRPTGEVLAAATVPSYDPARYKDSDPLLFRNLAVSDAFEPGSIFKPLVMASALDAGVVEPDTKCDICEGSFTIGEYTIKTWDGKYYKEPTMTDVIVKSNNVGMTFVARRLGEDKLWDYLDRFGIGRPTGIDIQEEASPKLRERGTWAEIDVATSSFGQGIAVTPIQFLRAFAALANHGMLPQPHIVAKLQDLGWEQDLKPKASERVLSEKAVGEMTEMMVKAVEAGEAKWAKPRGFRIAGKTGTAQIPIAGHYETDKTIASFVGFAPATYSRATVGKPNRSPQFVMLVTLREPTSSPWGSETAAPLWFAIARDLFPYLGIQPSE